MNPIENIWDVVGIKLGDYEEDPKGMLEFWERFQACWEAISKEECLLRIDSMLRRVEALIKAKGGYTKY